MVATKNNRFFCDKLLNGVDCQHSGIGSALLKAIETFALQENVNSIIIRPSFGTASWFLDRGFSYKDDFYMVKDLIVSEKK